MVKGASLLYAIFISLIIGVLCYSIVLLFSLNVNLENHFDLRKRLLLNNQSGLAYSKAYFQQEKPLKDFNITLGKKDITTFFKFSSWGNFSVFSITSASKRDTINQKYLVADQHHDNTPALYVRDNDEAFKISGSTKIIGDIFISNRGLKKVNLLGNSDYKKPIHTGKIRVSDKIFPKPPEVSLVYPEDYELFLMEDIHSSSIFNSFTNKTKVIEATTALENMHLKGNIIVRSKDTLVIYPSAVLEDIIIDAPKVIFRESFIGNLQVFSTNEVIVESNVKLAYPSVIVINSKEDTLKSIVFEGKSTISGAIFLLGDGLKTEDKNKVIIRKGAQVIGDIFCDGKMALYGTLKGSVYASSFIYESEENKYDNLIFNGEIYSNQLPNDFFQIPMLDQFANKTPIFVKKL